MEARRTCILKINFIEISIHGTCESGIDGGHDEKQEEDDLARRVGTRIRFGPHQSAIINPGCAQLSAESIAGGLISNMACQEARPGTRSTMTLARDWLCISHVLCEFRVRLLHMGWI